MRRSIVLYLICLVALVGCAKGKTDSGGGSGEKATAPENSRPVVAVQKDGVAPLPPGAPTDRPLLALPSASPPKFRWREQGVWKGAAFGPKLAGFALPADVQRVRHGVLSLGWKAAGSEQAAKFLGQQRALLVSLTRLPICAPLRKTYTDVMVSRNPGLVAPLKQVATALLLEARRVEGRGASDQAAKLTVAALRLACHMSQVPDVLMKISALAVERQAIRVARALLGDAKSCPRMARAVGSHLKRRAPARELDTTQWLQVRTSLRYVTAGLKVSKAASPSEQRRLDKLEKAIVERASTAYAEHALLVRRAMASDSDADWKKLDQWIAKLNREMAQLKKQHGTTNETELVMLLAKFPNKPVAWTASIVARVFMSMSTMGSSLWRPAFEGDRQLRKALRKLAATRCP